MNTADIAAMPVAEKLKLLEALWDSLCAESDHAMASPAWHAEVLEERLQRLAAGTEPTSPWREAKDRIRSQIQAD
jgi:putative addiction module component (TIGR02574 family)